MDWLNFGKTLSWISIAIAASAWVAKSAITHWLDRDVLYVKSAIERVEKLEANLFETRGAAYGEIWRLTGSLNLFGPVTQITSSDLSARLTDWYFERGWALTQESKKRYFLVQEVLNFLMLRSISFRRPADEELFSKPKRPVRILRKLRFELLNVEIREDEGEYSTAELETCLNDWKTRIEKAKGDELSEQAWILSQFLLSAFRSRMVEELGSREIGPHIAR